MIEGEKRLEVEREIALARVRANLLATSLILLRGGGRDLVLPMFEMEDNCENVRKACEFLKRRQRPLALDALETELDQRIVALGRLARLAKPEDRNGIVEILQFVRDYRRENPRRYEADLSYFDKKPLAKTRELWDEAEKILDEVAQPKVQP